MNTGPHKHVEDSLGEDVAEEIAQAFFDYKQKLESILSRFSDEKLTAYAGPVDREKIAEAYGARHLVPRMVADATVKFRRLDVRAGEVMRETGCKAYCVTHDCDWSQCACGRDD